jgi:cell division transport system ATP-binding protein
MITIDRVSVLFDEVPILTDINMHVRPGEFISLVGETGVGKTTLLRLIYFDLFPDVGTVTVGEYNSQTIRKKDVPNVRRTLGIVFQDYKLLDDRDVYHNVAFPLHVTGVKRAEIEDRVVAAVADVGLGHKLNSMPDELSGGEQQRVVIARSIVNRPLVLLADEPTGNLDPATSMEILELLREINAAGTAVILSTHNYELVRKSGSRIIQLKDGTASQIDAV